MKYIHLMAAFSVAASLSTSALAQNNDPVYHDRFQGFPNILFYIESCTENSTQLKSVFWLATIDENFFGSLLGPDLLEDQQASGQRAADFWYDLTPREHRDMGDAFVARFSSLIENNVSGLNAAADNQTAFTRAEHRDMPTYGLPSIQDALPDLRDATRVMSIDLAKSEGWDYINAGLWSVEVTPDSPACNGTPSVVVEEMNL